MSERDQLVQAVLEERDAALQEALFERKRADQALDQNAALRSQLGELRGKLRRALAAGPPAEPQTLGHLPPPPGQAPMVNDGGGLSERLRLAMDTNRRLERLRASLEKDLEDSRAALKTERDEAERLTRRLRAVEGALRIARGRS